MKKIINLICIITFVFGTAKIINAVPIDLADFSLSAIIVDFDDLAPCTVVDNQYIALGVDFNGAVISNPGDYISMSNSAINYPYVLSGSYLPTTITINFLDFTSAVGLTPTDTDNGYSTVTLTAFDYQGNILESVSTLVESTGQYNPLEDDFIGLAVNGISYVTITNTSGDTEFDDFIFEPTTPIPEPSTYLLLLFGLVGMVGIKKNLVDK